MCKSCETCINCPNYSWDNPCAVRIRDYPEEVVAEVEKWSKEHPVKTFKDDFIEKFPNALMDSKNEPRSCVRNIYGDSIECINPNCKECWNQPLREVK